MSILNSCQNFNIIYTNFMFFYGNDHRYANENEVWEVNYNGNKMLGKGDYGKVFKGKLTNRKTGIETKVAVKRYEMLRVDKSRTLIEMYLDHPNVVKFLYYEDVGDIFRYGTHFILY